MSLVLIKNSAEGEAVRLQHLLLAEMHHHEIVEGYLQTHRIRNHSEGTISTKRQILSAWFRAQPSGVDREAYVWETMAPMEGKRRIRMYAETLLNRDISPCTIRKYLNALHQFYCFVLEHPWVTVDGAARRIEEIYGVIEKPITEFDLPTHSMDSEATGLPIDPECIFDFLFLLREKYLDGDSKVKARNYAALVLAFETGLRIDELLNLEIKKDVFWQSEKIQTRFAKATNGSGKRTRTTLFPPLSRETIRYYLSNIRPQFSGHERSDYLFITNNGKPLTYSLSQMALNEIVACAHKNEFPIADRMTWHSTRRLFATRFIERFPDKLHVLVELLGHQGLSTVHRYIRHSKAWMDSEIQSVMKNSGKTS